MEKLQESKADKENVAMEMNIKADKAALESKVNVSTFDNTFSMLDEGLREALQKMDDYMIFCALVPFTVPHYFPFVGPKLHT